MVRDGVALVAWDPCLLRHHPLRLLRRGLPVAVEDRRSGRVRVLVPVPDWVPVIAVDRPPERAMLRLRGAR